MDELWRDIEGWPGYQVSNLGRIRSSFVRTISAKARWKAAADGWECWVLRRTQRTKLGYEYVFLQRAGKRRNLSVHRLVAQAFLPAPADGQVEVHHRDGVRDHNVVDNLEWSTVRGNRQRRLPKQHPYHRLRDQRDSLLALIGVLMRLMR